MTLGMKAFAGDMTNLAENGPLQTLLLHPTAPYWYLYALFFMFLFLPTAGTSRGMGLIFIFSILLKVVNLTLGWIYVLPYFINILCADLIWFASGMAIAHFELVGRFSTRTIIVGALFLPLSIPVYALGLGSWFEFGIGILACLCFVSVSVVLSGMWSSLPGFEECVKYTMPVYLMHTIFAARLRVVLLKLGVTSALVHISLGLTIGFVGPVVAMIFMDRVKPFDFFVYPNRYVKLGRNSK